METVRKLAFVRKLVPVAVVAVTMLLAAAGPSQAQADARQGSHPGAVEEHRGSEGHQRFEGPRGFEGRRDFDRDHHRGAFIGVVPWFYWAPAYPYGWDAYAYSPPQAYWYYCPSFGAYYPTVLSCPEPWVPVLPQ